MSLQNEIAFVFGYWTTGGQMESSIVFCDKKADEKAMDFVELFATMPDPQRKD